MSYKIHTATLGLKLNRWFSSLKEEEVNHIKSNHLSKYDWWNNLSLQQKEDIHKKWQDKYEGVWSATCNNTIMPTPSKYFSYKRKLNENY